VIFSTHCHNDLGMGVANSWRRCGGASQVNAPLTGIGERAGKPQWKRS